MDPATHSDANESTIAAQIPKSETCAVAASTVPTEGPSSAVDAENEVSPVTVKTTMTPQTQPQSIVSTESRVPPTSVPPATQEAPSNLQKRAETEVVSDNSSFERTTDSLPTNTITAEAETDSKELMNQSADSRSGNDSERTANSKTSSLSPSNVDTNSISIMREYDFITSPHGNNAIVERSPGGRYVRFMEKLGSGASKEVYRAYDTQEGIEVAWNVVHLAGVPRNERNRIVNEVQLLERLHHHNIISFHGSWVNRAEQQVNFVTEILSSGTLKSFITKVQVIRWKIAKRWAGQVLKGLEYLHSQDPPVIHRDLKCENIFINGTSGDLRIGDLGLSTVHRNGKQLSVLGTPEFMAPDMYEENPYDEKVDVYAFGMCMLEIFTKEIPYRECSNPAQIYKKVSRGDPPDCLKRIQSTHAREFIELCLGKLDENGKYIRPAASELLAHPFLQKRPNDDDIVELYPAAQDGEMVDSSNTSSPSMKVAAAKPSSSPTSSSSHGNEAIHGASSSSHQMQHSGSNSLGENETDKFEEMPDTEVNIRKITVLVGRGVELENNDDHVDKTPENEAALETFVQNGSVTETPPVNPLSASAQTPPTKHYLVAAAVIESDSNARPYEDDILKLVVTLPVEGQTQNVQFDFHLVQDDAIQVAKEMVAELGIPEGAVLEISETISGLARAARVSQDKYFAMQNAQGHVMSSSQVSSVSSLPAVPSNSDMAPASNQTMVPSTSHPSIPDFRSEQQQQQQKQQIAPQHSQTSHVGQPLHQQGMLVQEQPVPMSHARHASMPSLPMQPQQIHIQPTEMIKQKSQQSISVTGQQPRAHMDPMNASQQVAPPLAPPSIDTNATYGHSVPIPIPSQMGAHQTADIAGQLDVTPPVTYAQSQPAQISSQPATQASGHHVPAGHAMPQQSASVSQTQSNVAQVPAPQSHHVASQGSQGFANGIPPPSSKQPAPQHAQHVPALATPVIQQQTMPVQQAPPTQRIVSAASQPGSMEAVVLSVSPPLPVPTQDGFASMSHRGIPETYSAPLMNNHMDETATLPRMEKVNTSLESDNVDEELAVELRKLDEEFNKTVSRAKKVFDSRMDNMARLQHQREAEHQKTLTEHEKQRADFERRLQHEEIEQNRRIEQLQKKWESKRLEMKRIQNDSSPLDLEATKYDPANQTPIPSTAESQSEER